jgi:hypothetical protein
MDMLIENIIKNKLKKLIQEQIESEDDLTELLIQNIYDIFRQIKDKEKITFSLIDPYQYKRAMEEYMKYGQFIRFPENKILDWKELVLNNIAMLEALTRIHGHRGVFPFDEFYDVFDDIERPEKKDFHGVYDILYNEYDIDEYVPQFSNGQPVLSDFGIKPLYKLAKELIRQTKPEDIIITINKIMNVVHQRSDLSELFIRGGEESHSMISNT